MSTVSEQDEQRRPRSRPPTKLTTSEYTIGICLLFVVVLLWTSSNFLTQYVFVVGYQKPFMITYLSTASFTIYLLPACLRKSLRSTLSQRRNINYQPIAQEFSSEHDPLTTHSLRVADDQLTPEETAKLALYFCFLWFVANWALNTAIAHTSVASATILSSMSSIFTLALGSIFRVETLTLIKVAAVLTSFGGVALVSLSDFSSRPVPGPTSDVGLINFAAVLGDVLALLAALFYAVYMIFLKVQIKSESRIDMLLFFGHVGLFNTLLCLPIALLLHCVGVESLEFPGTTEAVVATLINMFITVSSDYLNILSMLKTTPLVATVGLSLTVPLAVIGDYFLGKPATFQTLLGAVLVTGGFIVVGVQNSKPGEGDGLLAEDLTGEEVREQAQVRLDQTVRSESEADVLNT